MGNSIQCNSLQPQTGGADSRYAMDEQRQHRAEGGRQTQKVTHPMNLQEMSRLGTSVHTGSRCLELGGNGTSCPCMEFLISVIQIS